jgi:beta-galactosidase
VKGNGRECGQSDLRGRVTRAILLILSLGCSAAALGSTRTELAFDAAWKFHRGDVAGAEQFGADDRDWALVETPHDWSIAGPFDEFAPAGGAGAFLPTGIAWYRKHFVLPKSFAGRRVFIEFDGVMANSGVWLNGLHLSHRPNGYAAFRVELTPRVHSDGSSEEVLAVRVDTAAQPASRWYAGSGIYRHVRLIAMGDVHIEPWGTAVSTPRLDAKSAQVEVASSVINQSPQDVIAHLEVSLVAPNGRTVAQIRGASRTLPFGRALPLMAAATLDQPHLWDITDPALHRALIKVVAEDGTVLDQESVGFGIREARFEAASGFWLNGRNLKIKGVAVHADAGAFGMAAPRAFLVRRLKGLQALGVNAVRTAHHPPSPEFLDVCDQLGLLVMDEAFDMWTVGKNPYDYHLYFTDWSSLDLRDFVRHDRNHPSVIIWSAGNEIHDTPYPLIAKAILARLLRIFHEEDPSRPVTMALFRPNTSGDYQNGLADMLDVVGQNYRENELAAAHADKPSRKIIGTENGMGRGNWILVRDNPAYAGMFLWVGVDYLGEAERVGWPSFGGTGGLMDRIGTPRPIGLERAGWWRTAPVVHIVRRLRQAADAGGAPVTAAVALPEPAGPSALADWSPRDRTPHDETVEVYSNAAEVELLLNGRSLGQLARPADDAPRSWTVPFTPGSLSARGYESGQLVAEDTLHTAGAARRLQLIAEQDFAAPPLAVARDAAADASAFDSLSFVRIEVVDAQGILVPDAADLVAVIVSGAGSMAALDNGNTSDPTPFTSPVRKVSGGRALLMLRSRAPGAPGALRGDGSITVAVSARGLRSATLRLQVQAP